MKFINIGNIKVRITFLLIILFSALLLSSCGKHDEVKFKIKYECTSANVCSIMLTPLDSVYQQDLIADQLLYSKEYPKNEVKDNIKWYPQRSAHPTLVNDQILEDGNLPDCSNGKCTYYSNPTGIQFAKTIHNAKIYVAGQATVKGKSYPVNLSTIITFAKITAPYIKAKGSCNKTTPKCSFDVTKKPAGGATPYTYKWFLDNKQIAETKSNAKDNGELTHEFKKLNSADKLYMIAVDKNNDDSPKSNTLSLGGLVITNIEGESEVGTSSTYQYKADVKENGTPVSATGYTWTLPAGWRYQLNTPEDRQIVKVITSGHVPASDNVKLSVVAKDTSGGSSSPYSKSIGVYNSSLGPTGGSVTPESLSVNEGSTVLYKASGFTASSAHGLQKFISMGSTVDADGYRWLIAPEYSDKFTLGNSSTSQVSVSVEDSSMKTIPAGAIGVEASSIGSGSNPERHYSKAVYSTRAVNIVNSNLGPIGGKITPESSNVAAGGEVTLDATNFMPQSNIQINSNDYKWIVEPMYASKFKIDPAGATSPSIKIKVIATAGNYEFSEIPAGSIYVIAHDMAGNPSKAVPLKTPIKITATGVGPKINSIDPDNDRVAYTGSAQTVTYTASVSMGTDNNSVYTYDWDVDKLPTWVSNHTIVGNKLTLTMQPSHDSRDIPRDDISLIVSDGESNVSVQAHASHDVTINGSDSAPTVTVTETPNGGKIPYKATSKSQILTYKASDIPGGTYSWNVPSNLSGKSGIRVSGQDAATLKITIDDTQIPSDGVTINEGDITVTGTDSHGNTSGPVDAQAATIAGSSSAPTVTVTETPNGGKIPYKARSKSQILTYKATGIQGGTYSWNVPSNLSGKSGIRVSGQDAATLKITIDDTQIPSDGVTINEGDITVTGADSHGNTSEPVDAQAATIAGSSSAPTVTVTETPNGGKIPYKARSKSQILTYKATGIQGGTYSWNVPSNLSGKSGIRVSGQDAATLKITIDDTQIPSDGVTINEGDITVTGADSHGNTSEPVDAQAATIAGSSSAPTVTVTETPNGGKIPYKATSKSQILTYKASDIPGGTYSWNVPSNLSGKSGIRVSGQDAATLKITIDDTQIPSDGVTINEGDITVTGTDSHGNTSGPVDAQAATIAGSSSAPTVTVTETPNGGKIPYKATSKSQILTYKASDIPGGTYSWNVPSNLSGKSGIRVSGQDAATLKITIDDTQIPSDGVTINEGDITVTGTDSHGNTSGPVDAQAATIAGSSSAPTVTVTETPNGGKIPYKATSKSQILTYKATGIQGGTYSWNVPSNLSGKSGIRVSGQDAATLKITIDDTQIPSDGVTINEGDITVTGADSHGNTSEPVDAQAATIAGSSSAPTVTVTETPNGGKIPYKARSKSQILTYKATGIQGGTYSWNVPSNLSGKSGIRVSGQDAATLKITIDDTQIPSDGVTINEGDITVTGADSHGNTSEPVDAQAATIAGSSSAPTVTVTETPNGGKIPYKATSKSQILTYKATGIQGGTYSWNVPSNLSGKSGIRVSGQDAATLKITIDDTHIPSDGVTINEGDITVTGADSHGNTSEPVDAQAATIAGSSSAPTVTVTETPNGGKIPYKATSKSQILTYKASDIPGGTYSWNVPSNLSGKSGIRVSGQDAATLKITIDDTQIPSDGVTINEGDITVTGTDSHGNTSGPVDAQAATIAGSSSAPTVTVTETPNGGKIPYKATSKSQILTYKATGIQGGTYSWNVPSNLSGKSGIRVSGQDAATLKITIDDTQIPSDGVTINEGDITVTGADSHGNTSEPVDAQAATIAGSSSAPTVTVTETPNGGKIPYKATSKSQILTYKASDIPGGTYSWNVPSNLSGKSGIRVSGQDAATLKITIDDTQIPSDGVTINEGDITVTGTDSHGNTSGPVDAQAATIAGSSSAPTVTVTETPNGGKIPYKATSKSQILTYKATGIQGGTYSWNVPSNLSGKSGIRVSGQDAATLKITIDDTHIPSDGVTINEGDITVTGTDSHGNTSEPVDAQAATIAGSSSAPTVTVKALTPYVPYNPSSTQKITYQATVTGGAGTNRYEWPTATTIEGEYKDIIGVDDSTPRKYVLTVKKGASDNETISMNNIKLTVTDSDGDTAIGNADKNVAINGPTSAPTGDISVTPTIVPYTGKGSTSTIVYTANITGAYSRGIKSYVWSHSTLPTGIKVVNDSSTSNKLKLQVADSDIDHAGASIDKNSISLVATDNANNESNVIHPTQKVTINGSDSVPTVSHIDVSKNSVSYNASSPQDITYTPHIEEASGGDTNYTYKWSIGDGVLVNHITNPNGTTSRTLTIRVPAGYVADTPTTTIDNKNISLVVTDGKNNKSLPTKARGDVVINSAPLSLVAEPSVALVDQSHVTFKIVGGGPANGWTWSVANTNDYKIETGSSNKTVKILFKTGAPQSVTVHAKNGSTDLMATIPVYYKETIWTVSAPNKTSASDIVSHFNLYNASISNLGGNKVHLSCNTGFHIPVGALSLSPGSQLATKYTVQSLIVYGSEWGGGGGKLPPIYKWSTLTGTYFPPFMSYGSRIAENGGDVSYGYGVLTWELVCQPND